MARFPEGIPLSRLRRTLGKKDVYGDLGFLEAAGMLVSEERLNRPAVRPKKEKWVRLTADVPPGVHLTASQSALIGMLKGRGEIPVRNLHEFFKNTVASLRLLEKKGFLHLYEKEVSRGPGPTPTIGKNEKGITLNEAQTVVLEEIRECLASGRFSPCLLHGVTGSGKTEVYLRAIAEVLRGRRRRDLPCPGDCPYGAAPLPHRQPISQNGRSPSSIAASPRAPGTISGKGSGGGRSGWSSAPGRPSSRRCGTSG